MSLQENSESVEDREEEDWRPCFSGECEPSSASECSSTRVDKVLNGMFAGRRGLFLEGIVKVVGLYGSSPVLRNVIGGE